MATTYTDTNRDRDVARDETATLIASDKVEGTSVYGPDGDKIAAHHVIVRRHFVNMHEFGFHLHRTFERAGRRNGTARRWRQAGYFKFTFFVPVSAPQLSSRHGVRS